MDPYTAPHSALAFVLEWGTLLVSTLLVFSPFIYLGIRKWKKYLPISWKQVILAYLTSFILYPTQFLVISKIDRFIYNNHTNAYWIQDALDESSLTLVVVLILAWPLLCFYCTKLVSGKISLKGFVYTSIVSAFILTVLLACLLFFLGWALTSVGNNYF